VVSMRGFGALGTGLALALCLSMEAPAQSPSGTPDHVVGFVYKVQGEWEDTSHPGVLRPGSDVHKNARIVRKDPSQSNASIVIYLSTGDTVRRNCASGGCGSPIVIDHDSEPRHRDLLKRLKDLFFGPPEQEVPAATFVYRVAPRQHSAACVPPEQPADTVTQVFGQGTCAPNPPSDKAGGAPDVIAPKVFIAGLLTENGAIDLWGAERVAPDGGKLPIDGKGGSGALRWSIGSLLSAKSRVDAPERAAESIDPTSVMVGNTWKVARPTSEGGGATSPRFCRDSEKRLVFCATDIAAPGVYAGDTAQLYVFSSSAQYNCMSEALDASSLLNKWIQAGPDREARAKAATLKTNYLDEKARACGSFVSLNRSDISPVTKPEPFSRELSTQPSSGSQVP